LLNKEGKFREIFTVPIGERAMTQVVIVIIGKEGAKIWLAKSLINKYYTINEILMK